MPRVDQSTINWAVYEDNTEYAGMAQATLPNLTALTQSISGAGIAGNVDAVILGHFDAMSMTLNYRTMTEQACALNTVVFPCGSNFLITCPNVPD